MNEQHEYEQEAQEQEREEGQQPEEQQAEQPERDEAGENEESRLKNEYVPLARLNQEIRRAQEAERRADLVENRFGQLFDVVRQGQPQQQEQPAPPPQPPVTYEDDPAGYLKWQHEQEMKALRSEIEPLKQAYQQHTQQSEQQQARARFEAELRSTEAEFVRDHNDYHDVLLQWSQQQFKDAVEWGLPPEIAVEHVRNQQLAAAWQARQAGLNPAQVAYNVAKRYATGSAPKPTGTNGQGGQQTRRASEADIERRAAGLEQSRSLSGVSGSAAAPKTGAEKLAKMTEDEFIAFKADLEQKRAQKGLKTGPRDLAAALGMS